MVQRPDRHTRQVGNLPDRKTHTHSPNADCLCCCPAPLAVQHRECSLTLRQGQVPISKRLSAAHVDDRSYTVVPPTVLAVKFASTHAWISEFELVPPPGAPPP